MNILILGATGRVGSHILSHALHDKHHVTVLVRDASKILVKDENLTIIQGNVLYREDDSLVMQGMDVVISALNTDRSTTLTESMPIIIEAMKKEKMNRIITIGTAGILQSRVNPQLLRYQSSESKRKSTRAAEEHHQVYNLLKTSDLDWTIVCPTYLPDGEHRGQFRSEVNFLPEGGTEISVPDTAQFMYKQLTSREYVKTRVGIAY